MLKKVVAPMILAFVASVAFNSVAVPNISCTYKFVDGEVKLVRCCDSSQCHDY